jgi:cell division septation protein DedD
LEKYNAPENKVILKHDFNISPTDMSTQVKDKNADSINNTANEYKKYFADRQQNPGFRVQVGVFERYEGAKEMVNSLRQLFTEPVTVINEYKDNKPVFKVRIGQFSTPEEAENFKKILFNEYNMTGIVL